MEKLEVGDIIKVINTDSDHYMVGRVIIPNKGSSEGHLRG